MSAQIIDGKALAAEIRSELAEQTLELRKRGRSPGLAVVLVGEDPASQVYVRNKIKACHEVGIKSFELLLPTDSSTDRMLETVELLANNHEVHGILVQLPLPGSIDEAAVLAAIPPHKDVDGFHAQNAGALSQGNPVFIPCTPNGVMRMLEKVSIDLNGVEAVVIGRSNIVGKPMAQLLTAAGATVTLCHSRTRDLAFHTRRADLVVAAVGRSRMLGADMIKPGAVVIDVGINRDDDGKLCGDIDFDDCLDRAGWITPVPGGVGPMTITMLLVNTLRAMELQYAG
jgi:methylenetetrahydrofolate dehydrogenase (NADP+)/methenyltetrahydrofolate cyclohydrolase